MRAGTSVADKPGSRFREDQELELLEDPNPYVGRGGLKLERALDTFELDPSGKIALDVGASTGGFTDCLLKRSATQVFAVDVGYGQLDWSLQKDERVVILDRTNARHLTPSHLNDAQPEMAVIDVSFISLKLVLPAVVNVMALKSDIVALVKPQFEVGKEEMEHKGIIKDPQKHLRVLRAVVGYASELKWVVCNLIESPITGQKGNREFLAHCVPAGQAEPVNEQHLKRVIGLTENE